MNKKASRSPRSNPARAVKQAKRPAQLCDDPEFKALPLKQRTFIVEYLANGFNATRAAITAGYAKANADTQGSRLLANVKVAALIARHTQQKLAKREITAEWVLDEIRKLAAFDIRKMYRPDGSLVPITELDDDTAAAIVGIEVQENFSDGFHVANTKKFKAADKGMNLERLGRYLKLFTDKVEHTGVLGVQLITSVPRPKRPDAGRAPLRGVLDAARKDKD